MYPIHLIKETEYRENQRMGTASKTKRRFRVIDVIKALAKNPDLDPETVALEHGVTVPTAKSYLKEARQLMQRKGAL